MTILKIDDFQKLPGPEIIKLCPKGPNVACEFI